MSDNNIIVKILGDDSHLEETLNNIGDKALGLGVTFAEAYLSFKGIQEGIQAVFEGEALQGIDAQFELLATHAGIAADSLKEGLTSASRGLTSEAELLKAANEGLVKLGSSAKQLPEIFELARKATQVFGGTTVDNFKAMENAIANGNVRALAHLGIQIDLKKALKDFAQEQGIGVDALTKAGRAQAILNAALEQGKTAYAGVSEDIKVATNAWNEMKASVTNLGETLLKAWSETIGPVLASIFKGFAAVANQINTHLKASIGTGVDAIRAQRQVLEEELTRAQAIAKFAPYDPQATGIDRLKAKIAELDKQLQAHTAEQQTAANAASGLHKRIFGDADIIAQDNNKIMAEMNKSRGEVLALQQKNFIEQDANNLSFSNHAVELVRNREDRIKNLEATYRQEKEAKELEFKKRGLTKTGEYQVALDNLELIHTAKRRAIEAEAEHFSTQMKKIARDGIVNGLTSAFSGLGKAMAQGGDAFGAFEKAALSAIGGIATQMGSMLVMAGLGWSVIPGFQASAAAVAEGLGLIVLGGVLEGIGGASGGSGGGSAGGGDFAGSAASPVANNTPTNQAQPGTMVNVQIHGNVLDNRQTGLAIVDAINEAYQNQGALIAQVSQT